MIKTIKDLAIKYLEHPHYALPAKEDEQYLVMSYNKENYVFDYRGILVFKTQYLLTESSIGYPNTYTGEYDYSLSDLPTKKKEIVCLNPDKYLSLEARYGLINEQGNLITKVEYQGFGEQWIVGKYIAAKKNDKFGYIDRNGRELTDFVFDYCNIDSDWHDHPNYDIVEILTEKIKYIDGSPIIKTKKGVVDWNGNLIIPPIYKDISIADRFSESWGFNPNKPTEAQQSMISDIIYITDFDGNNYQWTYINGLQSVSNP